MFFSITGLAWKTATAALPRLGDFFKISFPQTFPEPVALSIGEQFFTRTVIKPQPHCHALGISLKSVFRRPPRNLSHYR